MTGRVGEDQPPQRSCREYTILDFFSECKHGDHVSGQCHYIRDLAFITNPPPKSLEAQCSQSELPILPRAGQGSVRRTGPVEAGLSC